ncbi:CDP-alcohol phosphatidyltransferase family protein [Adhaeribacter soli]|uniref:CDP-alcohol phosphatidyltransferase family protein n=1 Tax=Adhaeribacter soli TaxID=2607655 RepID=A0A5N1J001_9BACT|nr:CDP-alcohol phosphatidyltransferase family protein [Adhaeribacter soli]KAA9340025.1 CDP-alcohol phosphatidyltransferase family protein [Adhaeribacter soli]
MNKLSTADWISLYRIIAVPFLLLALVLMQENWFKYLLLLSLFSDFIDGPVARRLKQTSGLGSSLDSVGDLLTQVLMVAGLFRFRPEVLQEYVVWFLVLLGLYLLQVLCALVKYRKLTSFHTYLSKMAFLLLGMFVLALFFYRFASWLFYPAMVVGMLSLAEEIMLVLRLPVPKEDVKGMLWVWKSGDKRK